METLHRQVMRRLGEHICSGSIQPGELLPAEPQLAQQYDVSRITIREAVKALSAKGMLAVRRKLGTVVLPRAQWQLFDPDVMRWRASVGNIDAQLVGDLLELRRIIEPAAAGIAARRASADDLLAMRTAYNDMVRAVAADDGQNDDYVDADVRFHAAILSASTNQFIQQMQNALSAILDASFKISAAVEGSTARSLPVHEQLCIAIERRDAAGAEAAVIALLLQAEQDLEKHFGILRRHDGDGSRDVDRDVSRDVNRDVSRDVSQNGDG